MVRCYPLKRGFLTSTNPFICNFVDEVSHPANFVLGLQYPDTQIVMDFYTAPSTSLDWQIHLFQLILLAFSALVGRPGLLQSLVCDFTSGKWKALEITVSNPKYSLLALTWPASFPKRCASPSLIVDIITYSSLLLQEELFSLTVGHTSSLFNFIRSLHLSSQSGALTNLLAHFCLWFLPHLKKFWKTDGSYQTHRAESCTWFPLQSLPAWGKRQGKKTGKKWETTATKKRKNYQKGK